MPDQKQPRSAADRGPLFQSLRMVLLVTAALAFVGYSVFLMACSESQSTYVRGSEDPTVDEPAMSSGLDKKDLEALFDENISELLASRYMGDVSSASPRHTIAIMPFINDTSEHISPQLNALLSKMETTLVKDGRLEVIAAERRDEILREMRIQQGAEFDQSRAVSVGRQLGANYVITGKVYDSAERTDDMRRTQYFLFLQVIDVETGAIKFQHESQVTKALVPVET